MIVYGEYLAIQRLLRSVTSGNVRVDTFKLGVALWCGAYNTLKELRQMML